MPTFRYTGPLPAAASEYGLLLEPGSEHELSEEQAIALGSLALERVPATPATPGKPAPAPAPDTKQVPEGGE